VRFGLVAGVALYFLLVMTTKYLEETYLPNDESKDRYTHHSHHSLQDYVEDYQPQMIQNN
jgi:hypothetical protein